MSESATYGGLKLATINENDARLSLADLDVTGEVSLKIKHTTAPDYASLVTDPQEVEDIYLVVHYQLG